MGFAYKARWETIDKEIYELKSANISIWLEYGCGPLWKSILQV